MIPWLKSEPRSKTAPAAAKRVLVIKLGGVAEFVQALGAAKAIRDYHVGARITVLTTEPFKALAEKCPYFDTVEIDTGATAPPPPAPSRAAASVKAVETAVAEAPPMVQLINKVRSGKYEMIYDLDGSKRTGALYTGLRAFRPMWSAPVQSGIFSDNDNAVHPLDKLAQQLQAAGLPVHDTPLPDLSWIRVALRDPPRLQPDYFGIRGRYVLLLPRGSNVAPARRWPVEKWVQLATQLAENGVTPVVLGSPEEREIGAAIAAGEKRAKNLVTRPDLFQTAGLAERAAFAVGDDVDLLHVVAAAGAPCLVLLSSRAEPERNSPRGRGGVVALTAAVVADLPVDQVDRQLKNCGVYARAIPA